jgi:PAS domain S-box-containing protein
VAERTRQASPLNLTHDTIFVRDMSDVIAYWNRGAQELFGWTAQEAIGKHAHQLLQTVSPMPIDAIDAELLRTGGWEGELEKIKADGTRVVVSGRWSLVRDEQERPVAILATNNDITQRQRSKDHIRKLNEALAKRSAELEATNRELEAFAYSVSHDLRAPLRHMVGYTELLQPNATPILDGKSRRYMMMILESAKQISNLIDDLLAFSVKFTRIRPQAEIEIGCADGGEDEIVVFIRDNGIGFDMKYVKKLFGVFQRLHRTEEFEGHWYGIG